MLSGIDWRASVAYRHAKTIPAAGFAWEYLIRVLIDWDSWASQTAMNLNLWCKSEDWHGRSDIITGRF